MDPRRPVVARAQDDVPFANIGTAVVIFPIVKRQSEELALGLCDRPARRVHVHPRRHRRCPGDRQLRQEVAGAAEGSIAYTLAAIRDWTFFSGRAGRRLGERADLGYLMYSSGLVPRQMAWLGLVGGPLIILSGTLVLFGVADKSGALQGIATMPEFLWELSLGFFCTLKGFRPSSPILDDNTREGRVAPMPASSRA